MILSSFVRVCLGLGAALLVASSAFAQITIEYSALGNNIRDPDGTLADDGQLVRLGFWAPGFDFVVNDTFSELNGSFTQVDSTTTTQITSDGEFFGDEITSNNAYLDKQLYIWILNTATATDPSAWVILTNPAWRTPASGPNTLSLDTSDAGTFIPMGALGEAFTPPFKETSQNGVDWQIEAIPEPSTYALIAVGSAALLAVRRRRTRS